MTTEYEICPRCEGMCGHIEVEHWVDCEYCEGNGVIPITDKSENN